MRELGTVIPAMVTPFDGEGQVNLPRMGELAVRLVQQGADGLLVSGTTGESPTLTGDEKMALLETVLEAVGGQVPIMCGTGSNNTRDTIGLTRRAEAQGADSILLVTPYYNKPPQRALVEHFRTVAETTSLPIIVYNIPGRTGTNIEPTTLAEMAQAPNIVGVKESTKNLEQATEIRRLTPPDFVIYSGDDSMTLPLLAVGGHGVISVAGHLVAGMIRDMIQAYGQGRVQEAARLHGELYPLFQSLFVTTNPIPVKAALGLAGFDVGGTRMPLVPPTEGEVEKIRACMEPMGLVAS